MRPGRAGLAPLRSHSRDSPQGVASPVRREPSTSRVRVTSTSNEYEYRFTEYEYDWLYCVSRFSGIGPTADGPGAHGVIRYAKGFDFKRIVAIGVASPDPNPQRRS